MIGFRSQRPSRSSLAWRNGSGSRPLQWQARRRPQPSNGGGWRTWMTMTSIHASFLLVTAFFLIELLDHSLLRFNGRRQTAQQNPLADPSGLFEGGRYDTDLHRQEDPSMGANKESSLDVDLPAISNFASPLDNYYSRRHLAEDAPPTVLIIGGSDGSGTRAFADMVARLGVPMLVDDDGTYDVHGLDLFAGQGWPPLVQLLINYTHSAHYEFDALPPHIQDVAWQEMGKFQARYGIRAHNLRENALLTGKRLATRVQYGFKAPPSMLLLPLLRQVYGSIKFIHVVRDGRDVALSINTSPVDKFYDTFYQDAAQRRLSYQQRNTDSSKDNQTWTPVLAMELWNDWNQQTLAWEQQHADDSTFDYLVMRTEDLLNPATRLESLWQLADFVGSPRTGSELCCLSQRELVDMGPSDARHRPDVRDTQEVGHQRRNHDASPPDADDLRPEKKRSAHRDFFAQLQAERNKQQRHVRQQHRSPKPPVDDENHDDPRHVGSRRRLFGESAIGDTDDAVEKIIAKMQTIPAGVVSSLQDELADRPDAVRPDLAGGSHPVEETGDDESLLEPSSGNRRREAFRQMVLKRLHDPAKQASYAQSWEERSKLRKKTGSLFRHRVGTAADVQQRYGKWVTALQGREELSRWLHARGAEGLATFGYQPPARFLDRHVDREACLPCTSSPRKPT